MDSINRKKRSANITNEQKTLLIEFMDKHLDLVKGKFTSSFTMKTATSLWMEISAILNAANGTRKDWKEWRKVNIFIKFGIHVCLAYYLHCNYIYVYNTIHCSNMHLVLA